jgi:Ala-tRNA(Pro) deacylase
MNGDPKVYEVLQKLNIEFKYLEHPPAPTIEIAKQYWAGHDGQHCKNLFFRNHKGNRHYLVIFDCDRNMAIHEIEKILKQGKLSFASEQRMQKYLGLKPGSVSPFGLIHDPENHVYVFIDEALNKVSKVSFHPNDNTSSLIISMSDFVRFMDFSGNPYQFIKLY